MRPSVLRGQGRHPAREAALLSALRPRARWLAAVASALPLLAAPIAAPADEKKEPNKEQQQESDACVDSYELSQQLRRTSDLVRAKAELRLCLGACPRALARDCERWLKEVERQLGRVAVQVVDAEGRPVEAARVLIDGLPARPNEKGEVEINPGRHAVRAEAEGMEAVEQEIGVESGGQASVELRLIEEKVEPPPPLPPPPVVVESSTPVAGLVVGAVGLLGLGVGGALALVGHLERSELRSECAPYCVDADVEAIRRLWIGGGISAGVGAIALGVGIGLVLTHDDEPASSGRRRAPWIVPVAHVQPGSAGLGVVGRF